MKVIIPRGTTISKDGSVWCIHETRGYDTAHARKRAYLELRKLGFNSFVPFHDVSSRYALMFSRYPHKDGQPEYRCYGL